MYYTAQRIRNWL